MRIGVTGHMDLAPESFGAVRLAIDTELAALRLTDKWTGVSCIARGADTIFAEAVVEAGGNLEVVVPSRNYRDRKVKADHAPIFDSLLEQATKVHTLPFDEANREAYEAANNTLIEGCDRLFAIWDGNASQKGGTATVVETARSLELPVTVIWPAGTVRKKY